MNASKDNYKDSVSNTTQAKDPLTLYIEAIR